MRFVGSLNTDKLSDSGNNTVLKNTIKCVQVTHIKKVTAPSVSKETLKACIGRPPLQRQAFVGSQKEVLALRYIAMKLGVEVKMCQTIQGFVMLRKPQNTLFQSNQTASYQLIMIYGNSKP